MLSKLNKYIQKCNFLCIIKVIKYHNLSIYLNFILYIYVNTPQIFTLLNGKDF